MNYAYRPYWDLPEPEPSKFVREVFVDGVAVGRIDKDKYGYNHACYGMEMGGGGHDTEAQAEAMILMDYKELQYHRRRMFTS